MSENTEAYVNAYLEALAGAGVELTPRLVEIFSGVLERQLEEDEAGNITQKTSFETLAKVFTFISSPVGERPNTPNDYTQEDIDAAQAAAETAVEEVSDALTLANALALGEDLPEEYNIVDTPENLFDNVDVLELAPGAEDILDGAASIDIDGAIYLGRYNAIRDLPTFEIENLDFDLIELFEHLINDPNVAEIARSYDLSDDEGTDFGRVTEAEAALIEGAESYEPGFWEYNLPVPGETFVLEAGLNEGTDGDDLFIGTRGSLDGAIIDGKDGLDTVRVTVDNANDDGAALTSSNLEIAEIRALDGTAIDFGDATGLEQAWSNRSAGALTLENATADTTFGIRNSDQALTVEISGVQATDTVKLALDEALTGSQFVAATAATLSITTAEAASNLDLNTADVTNAFTEIMIAGDQDLDLGTLNAEVETIAAADFAGGLTATFDTVIDKSITTGSGDDVLTLTDDAADGDSVSTGAGDDRIVMNGAAGDLDANDTIDGGEGEDTLAVLASADTIGFDATSTVTNVENLEITSVATTDAIDLDDINVDSVIYLNTDDDDELSATNAEAENFVVETGSAAGNDVVGSLTVALKDATGDADSVDVSVKNNLDGTAGALSDLTVDDVETLNVNATFDEDITTEANQVVAITAINADAAETINFTGDATLTTEVVDAVTDQVINAAAMTGAINLTAVAAADLTITGSAGDDTFTMTANMDGNDTIDGGDGDDTVEAAVDSTSGDATVTLADISNVETITVAATQDAAEAAGETATVDASNVDAGVISLTGSALNTANDDTLAVTNLQAGVSVDINDSLANAGSGDYLGTIALEDATGDSDSLTISLTDADGQNQTVDSLTIADVETINIAVTADETNGTIDTVTITDLDINGATTLAIVSEEDLDVTVDESDALETIDLSGAVEDVTLSLDGTDDTGVSIQLGNPTAAANDILITLDSDEGASDIIKFADSEVGDVEIVNFSDGDGILADILDFSALGITGIDELTLTESVGGNSLINADAFDGEIQLTGVTNAQLNAANFDFA